MRSWETRPPQSGEYYGAGDHYWPALPTELPVMLASQPVHFRQETTHIPADLKKIKTFQNSAMSSLLTEPSSHSSFNNPRSKTQINGFIQGTSWWFKELKAAFWVCPLPRHLQPCEDHHHTAPLPPCSSTWALLVATESEGPNSTCVPTYPSHRDRRCGGGGRIKVS